MRSFVSYREREDVCVSLARSLARSLSLSLLRAPSLSRSRARSLYVYYSNLLHYLLYFYIYDFISQICTVSSIFFSRLLLRFFIHLLLRSVHYLLYFYTIVTKKILDSVSSLQISLTSVLSYCVACK